MVFDKSLIMRIYRNHINSFFEFTQVNPDTYFQDKRDYNNDLLIFWQSISDLAPITRAGRITCVKQFMEENDIQIPRKVWNKIKKNKKVIYGRLKLILYSWYDMYDEYHEIAIYPFWLHFDMHPGSEPYDI